VLIPVHAVYNHRLLCLLHRVHEPVAGAPPHRHS
jgi:hypothetical protein